MLLSADGSALTEAMTPPLESAPTTTSQQSSEVTEAEMFVPPLHTSSTWPLCEKKLAKDRNQPVAHQLITLQRESNSAIHQLIAIQTELLQV